MTRKMGNNEKLKKLRFAMMEIARFWYRVISPTYRSEWRRAQEEVRRLAPKKGEVLHLLDVNEAYNQKYFASRQFEAQSAWSDRISECIYNVHNPKSVVDFGCGPGLFLRYFYKKNIQIKGYEGSLSAFKKLVIPKKFVEHADFRCVLDFKKKKYNIAICFEVAEHIEKEFAGLFLYNLTRLSDTVFFTAAPPYISPKHPHHPNEQPIEYWDTLFAFYGYITDELKTADIQKELKAISFPSNIKHYASMKVYKKVSHK